MSALRKLYEKLRQKPNNTPFEDVVKLLEGGGMRCQSRTESHSTFVLGDKRITIAYRRPSLKGYLVREALEVFRQVMPPSFFEDGES